MLGLGGFVHAFQFSNVRFHAIYAASAVPIKPNPITDSGCFSPALVATCAVNADANASREETTVQNQFFGKSKIPMAIKLQSHAHVKPILAIMLIVELKRPSNGHVMMRATVNVSDAVTRKAR